VVSLLSREEVPRDKLFVLPVTERLPTEAGPEIFRLGPVISSLNTWLKPAWLQRNREQATEKALRSFLFIKTSWV
jgi:hypothetical protein